MNNKHIKKSTKLMVIMMVIVTPLAILLWFNQHIIQTFITMISDRQAVITLLGQLGLLGPLVLMGLIGLQVLIPSLPAEPQMIAGAYVYGFTPGFLMSWLVSVAASQAVFYLARYTGRPIVERFVPAELLDEWTQIASERGTLFFLLAFIIPPIPSDIMNYVAGLSEIEGRRFFVANFFGRIPMVSLFTLVGANGFSITPTLIVGLTVFGALMLMTWWYFIVRQHQDTVAVCP